MIIAMFAATLILTESAPIAPPSAPTTAAAQPVKKKSDNEMTCKSEPVLGSRMPVRKCRTVAQAEQEKADAQADLAKAQGAMANNPH